jgi:murein DD-endopeptidase MepM/ murein hydrolase activator NlpD
MRLVKEFFKTTSVTIMVKFIGADKAQSSPTNFAAPSVTPQVLASSDSLFKSAAQTTQQTGDTLRNSLQGQASLAAQMSKDSTSTSQTVLQASQQTAQADANNGGFAKAMGNLANVGNMIVQTLDNRDKQYATQAKQQRDANAATMWDKVSQWEVDAPQTARLDPGGTAKLRTQVQDIFASTEGQDISNEDRQALMKHAYGNVIAGLASKNVEDVMSQQKKLQEVNVNTRTQRAIFESTTLLSSLGAATTAEEQQASITKLSTFLGAVATSNELDPMSKAEIQHSLTQAMNKALFTSEDNKNKATETLQQFQKFQNDVVEARSKYPNDQDAQDTMIAYSAHVNKIPNGLADRYSLVEAQKRAIERVDLNDKERNQRNEEVARNLGVAGSDDEAGYDAELFKTKASLEVFATELGGGNAEAGRKTSRYIQVVEAQKALADFQKAQSEANGKYAELKLEKEKLGQGDAARNLAYLKTLQPSEQTSDLIKRLQISTGNNPALAAFLPMIGQYEAMDAAKRQAYDNAYAQAVQQGFDASAAVGAVYDEKATLIGEDLKAARDKVTRYGFGYDGRYDPFKAKQIEQLRIQREAKRQAEYGERLEQQANGGSGGATSPAPFSRGTSYFNGIEVLASAPSPTGELILPMTKSDIKKQGGANINEGVGWREWKQRQHNGQDVGVDPKTPILAQMDGVVRKVEYQEGGAGNYIQIDYPDGSNHVFMHLYERPNLAVGQKVKAGQVVGAAGNTGLPGGNDNPGNTHLHWEVWYGDKRSTPQEWSAKYKQQMANAPKQPRGGGDGSSITSPRNGVGVPIKGGALVPDGKGGANVYSYRGTNIKDSGQQIQRPPIDSSVSGRIYYGPGGSRFQRNAKGDMVKLDAPIQVQQGATSPANYPFTKPLRNLTNSNRAVDYNRDDLDNNHGFQALKKSKSTARAVNETARSLGVPGEWLAEVISVETDNKFDPALDEYGGSGAAGLIQFYPDVDGGSVKTINGKVFNISDIKRMSLEQQLRGPVVQYIKEAMNSNGMKSIPTIQDLYGLVYAYGPASKAVKMRDQRGASGAEILGRLGKFSGRKYSSLGPPANSPNIASSDIHNSDRASRLTTRVDTKPVSGCASCQQMVASNMFVPHERVNLNKGSENFNYA